MSRAVFVGLSLLGALLVGASDKPNSTSPLNAGSLGPSVSDRTAQPVQARFHMVLYDGERNSVLNLNFQTDRTSGDAFRSKPGVWLRASGQGLNSAGSVTAHEMDLALRIKVGELPKVLFRTGENSTVLAVSTAGVDFFHLTREPISGTTHATVVSFGGQKIAEFQLSPEWDGLLLDERETGAVLAEVYGLLTTTGGGGRAVGCSPTFSECNNIAQNACSETGLKYFHYSCDPETGAVVCEYECFPPEGGD